MKLHFDFKPLSVNEAWQGRRFKTPKYRQFTQDIEYSLLSQKNEIMPVSGNLEVICNWYLINNKKTDVDNLLKPLLDSLVENEIIKDDRFIQKLIVTKHKSKTNHFDVEIKEIE